MFTLPEHSLLTMASGIIFSTIFRRYYKILHKKKKKKKRKKKETWKHKRNRSSSVMVVRVVLMLLSLVRIFLHNYSKKTKTKKKTETEKNNSNKYKLKKRYMYPEGASTNETKGAMQGDAKVEYLGPIHTYPDIFLIRTFFYPDSKIFLSTRSVFQSNSPVHVYPMISGLTLVPRVPLQ